MDHQAHILLVDPQAEGIGGADDPRGTGDELLLHLPLLAHIETCVKRFGCPRHPLQVFRSLFSVCPRRGVHDSRTFFRQTLFQDIVDLGELLGRIHQLDFEAQVFPLHGAFEKGQGLPQFPVEMLQDLLLDIRFGRRGETGDRRNRHSLLLGKLADEARDVQIIGSEVVSPLGQTVRFVEHPAADFALFDHLAEGAVAQLFGRYVEQSDIAQAHPVEHLPAFGRREQTVERGRNLRPRSFEEIVHLILHQGLQWRDDQGQQPAPEMADHGGKLVAQRLASSGGHNSQQRRVGHTRAHDSFLETVPFGRSWFRTEGRKAEIALERLGGIVIPGAIQAFEICARHIPQTAQDPGHLCELVPHPAWNHRIGASHPQPGRAKCHGSLFGRFERDILGPYLGG